MSRRYPHTPYFNFSPSVDRDDVRESGYFNISNFINKRLIITIKLDGSNCLMTRDFIAARNAKYATGQSFNYAKQLHATICSKIPENIKVYGEWLYSRHSIHYDEKLPLDALFQIFAIYNENTDIWGSWNEVCLMSSHLGFINVPAIRILEPTNNKGFIERAITEIGNRIIAQGHEGIVVRNIEEFLDFNKNVAKYVRADHVQSSKHWSKETIVRNVVKGTKNYIN